MTRLLPAAVLILSTALLRRLLRRVLPQRLLVFCWLLCLGILLSPWELRSPLSLYRLLPKAPPRQLAAVLAALPGGLCRAVSLVLIAVLGAAYIRALLRFHRAAPVTAEAVHRWQAQHPLRRPLQIRADARVQTPACCGVLFPVILLPEALCSADEATLDCVLSHEYCHILHFDPLWKLLSLICLCLYWYLPPVWLLFVLLSRDLEFACDEDVLRSGVPDRRYCRTLLTLALTRGAPGTLAAHFAAGQVGRRVDRMLRRPGKPAAQALAAALLLTLTLGLAALPPVTVPPKAAPVQLISDHRVLTVPALAQDRAVITPEEVP